MTTRDQTGVFYVKPDTTAAKGRILDEILKRVAAQRDGIGDSDLVDEQSVCVSVCVSLGDLRKAGLGSVPGYCKHEGLS